MSEGRFDEPQLDEIMSAVLQRRRIQGASGGLRMESELNFPVVSSQTFTRFQIESGRGILDSNTTLQMTLNQAAGGIKRMVPPIAQGAMAWIDKASLKIGGATIALTESARFLKATQAGNTPADDQECLHHYLIGNQAYFKDCSPIQSGGINTVAGVAVSQMDALGNLRYGGKDPENPDQWLNLRDGLSSNGPGNAGNLTCIYGGESATWSIKLDELFPFLKSNQLPLLSMSDDVFVEIVLNPNAGSVGANGSLVYTSQGDRGGFVAADTTFDLPALQIMATHLYYDDQVMERIQREHETNGISFLYEDYAFTQRGVPAMGAATGEETQMLDLGGQSKVIRQMLVHKQVGNPDTLHYGEYATPDSHYRSLLAGVLTEASESFQLEINDELVFVRPIDKSATLGYHYSLCGDNGDLWIPKCVYSNESYASGMGSLADDGAAATGLNLWFGDEQADILGEFAPRGFFFGRDHENTEGNGVRVGSKPIRMVYNRKGLAAIGLRATTAADSQSALTFRVWMKFERRFSLINGRVNSSV